MGDSHSGACLVVGRAFRLDRRRGESESGLGLGLTFSCSCSELSLSLSLSSSFAIVDFVRSSC